MTDGAARTCPHCGAVRTAEAGRSCADCGAELSGPPPGPETLSARFAALARDPELHAWAARRPSVTAIAVQLGFGVIFAGVFVGVASFVLLQSGDRAVPAGFRLVPGFMLLVGLGMAVTFAARALRFARAPRRHEPALVTGKRTKITHGGRNTQTSTTDFVTLEFADGQRHEYRARGPVMGRCAEGDLGLAFLKGEYLLDFARPRG